MFIPARGLRNAVLERRASSLSRPPESCHPSVPGAVDGGQVICWAGDARRYSPVNTCWRTSASAVPGTRCASANAATGSDRAADTSDADRTLLRSATSWHEHAAAANSSSATTGCLVIVCSVRRRARENCNENETKMRRIVNATIIRTEGARGYFPKRFPREHEGFWSNGRFFIRFLTIFSNESRGKR